LWVRVPVYVGDFNKIELQKEATIQPFGADPQSAHLKAKPVQGPPLSDAGSASADLFYEILNPDGAFRIGQKVSISLVRKSAEDSLVVPASAILYDIDGGNWVYTRTAPHVYARRRVEVSHFLDNFAVLTRGLKAGEEVVVAGAVELFGTEFGVGK
jgi:multidrug efflux pump subunit AcrA (membrane-fusion protein)